MQTICVGIHDLLVTCIIGIRKTERMRRQTIKVDIELGYEGESLIKSGDISDAVDYMEVSELTRMHLQQEEYGLLECAAFGIIRTIFESFEKVLHIQVCIKKFGAVDESGYAYVRMQHSRNEIQ